MQTSTTPQNEPVGTGDRGVVEREVETVRTRQSVAGAPGDGMPAHRAATGGRSGGYFETLPERLRAVGFAVLTALEALLGLRFLLHAFGANANNSFVGFIDDVSWPFVRPFSSIFSNRSWGEGVVESSTLVAMGVYFLLFALIGMLVVALAPRMNGSSGRTE